MADVGLRLNLDAEEVELTVDGEVAMTSGKDVFHSWVNAFNEKHKSLDEPVEEKVVDETTVEEVVDVDNPVHESVDSDKKE